MKDGMEVQEGIWCGIWRIKSRNGESIQDYSRKQRNNGPWRHTSLSD